MTWPHYHDALKVLIYENAFYRIIIVNAYGRTLILFSLIFVAFISIIYVNPFAAITLASHKHTH